MAKFGRTSKKRIGECDVELQDLFNEVIYHYNCTVLVGHRGKGAQNKAFENGKSKLKFPQSKHNKKPSLAVDVAPWFSTEPHIRWGDRDKFYEFMGFVQGVACMLGINIRVGGNWDMDDELHDQTLMDLVHFEVIE